MKLYVLGVIASVLGGVGLISWIVFLRIFDGTTSDVPVLFGLAIVGWFAAPIGSAIAVAVSTPRSGLVTVALGILAAAGSYLTWVAVASLPGWTTVSTLLLCEGECPPPPGTVERNITWIVLSLVYLTFAIARFREPRTVLLLVLAATPLASVGVFLATPSTHPSTTTPRSPAQAETEA